MANFSICFSCWKYPHHGRCEVTLRVGGQLFTINISFHGYANDIGRPLPMLVSSLVLSLPFRRSTLRTFLLFSFARSCYTHHINPINTTNLRSYEKIEIIKCKQLAMFQTQGDHYLADKVSPASRWMYLRRLAAYTLALQFSGLKAVIHLSVFIQLLYTIGHGFTCGW